MSDDVMSTPEEKSWLDSLSEILSAPLPGTEGKTDAPQPPRTHKEEDDDDSLLDRITDILTQPLPGTEQASADVSSERAAKPPTGKIPSQTSEQSSMRAPRDDQGKVAVDAAAESADDAEDPAVMTGSAGADWMQREYERFSAHQQRERQRFAERQRFEQERFFDYQKRQLEQFSSSQQREQMVFRKHQEARSAAWRGDMRHHYVSAGRPFGAASPGMAPPPPPPPPWWREKRKRRG